MELMTMKHILIHPLTLAALLVIVTPLLLIAYYYCVWLLVG